jgi:exopolysaccharide biosynthesis polyprenyl glycosylphosphotransferase
MKAERANRVFIVYLVLTDMAMAALAFGLAYVLRTTLPFPEPAQGMRPFGEYIPMLFIHVFSVLAVSLSFRLYTLRRSSRFDEFYGIVGATFVGTLMGVALASLTLRDFVVGRDYSRAMVGYAWFLSMLLMMVGRLFNSWFRQHLIRQGWGRRRVLIVGTGDIARMILQKITWTPELGYNVAGVVSLHETDQMTLLEVPVVGTADNLGQIIDAQKADEVIIALPEETSHHDILWLISECERGRVTIRVYPDLFQIMAGPVSIGEMGGIPILTVRDIALTGWRRSAKRLMDIVGASAALVILSPFMILTAIAIKLESPGPVFFVQERMGLDAKPFPILKFRSMRADAEKHGTWTAENDPRRTKIGALLRKTNIDEFPQFVNILLGDMSLVGPRPEQPFYVEQFRRSIPRYMDRHREKAGLTGWAQVNGYRQDTSIVERTKYDLWYIENWSLLLDIKIIIRSALQFFHSPNAY